MTVDLYVHLARLDARKRALGIPDDESALARLRNPGDRRTEEKRDALRRIDARARDAGG